ncbi:membrane-anchored protein YejM (alkaline phosphatase superfamily) [Cytobacillus horneckiae]|uniref:Transcriptional regulator n=1 Tax=Cytobacillus horneckiae TaxID=549687 RepID=A0A2N0ZL83_9BACI|nr:PLD nuclease N-terminal domain-containing protein [Cytobacillus horneckiae]MBN6885673.1 PLDc_N domain-containing protein [Cytobacillus horneckiae]MCM3177223.1 PLD nuclease N-terminal domain-containing protein [Cytobacillus horneckiae]MEC1156216.1 PLD nuclease N-terminal domain-containing protein [Cytobacillus horneckiae]MED2938234.1 PLD nuclease N-terminal domain-containing protein [Cytobacillus horneckiae]PKG30243.1 transcriptional regulator [Cytobacillus horneckiae]
METISTELILMVMPIILIQLILMVIAIIDIVRNEHTKGPKWLWILAVIFINIIGPIVYFIFGRRTEG